GVEDVLVVAGVAGVGQVFGVSVEECGGAGSELGGVVGSAGLFGGGGVPVGGVPTAGAERVPAAVDGDLGLEGQPQRAPLDGDADGSCEGVGAPDFTVEIGGGDGIGGVLGDPVVV